MTTFEECFDQILYSKHLVAFTEEFELNVLNVCTKYSKPTDSLWEYIKNNLFSESPKKCFLALKFLESYLRYHPDVRSQIDTKVTDSSTCLNLVKLYLSSDNASIKNQLMRVILTGYLVFKKTHSCFFEDIANVIISENTTVPSILSSPELRCSGLYLETLDDYLEYCEKCRTLFATRSTTHLNFYGTKIRLCFDCDRCFSTKITNQEFKNQVLKEVKPIDIVVQPRATKQTFSKFYDDGDFTDIELVTENFTKRAHKVVLAAESSFFQKKFEDPFVRELELHFMEPDALNCILEFIYKGNIANLNEKADKLLIVADKLGMTKLKALCEKFLYEDLEYWNALQTMTIAKEANASLLRKGVANFIRKNKKQVLKLPNWQTFCDTNPDLMNEIFVNIAKFSTISLDGFSFMASKKIMCDSKVQVSKDMEKLFETKKFSDFVIKVKNYEIPVHKSIMYHKSSYFEALFSHNFVETSENVVKIEGFDYEVVNEMMRFLYCGEVKNIERVVYDLLKIADIYDVIHLKNFCESYLIDNLNHKNALKSWIVADKTCSENLKKCALDSIKMNITKYLKEPEWPKFYEKNPNILEDLINLYN